MEKIKSEITNIIREKFPQYKKEKDDNKLFKLIFASAFRGLANITLFFDKFKSFYTLYEKNSKSQIENSQNIFEVLKDVKSKISQSPYEKYFSKVIEKIDSFSKDNIKTELTEIIKLLEEIKKNKFPERMFLGGGGGGLDQESKDTLKAIKENTDSFEINAENINLNTDTLESLLTDLKNLLTSLVNNGSKVKNSAGITINPATSEKQDNLYNLTLTIYNNAIQYILPIYQFFSLIISTAFHFRVNGTRVLLKDWKGRDEIEQIEIEKQFQIDQLLYDSNVAYFTHNQFNEMEWAYLLSEMTVNIQAYPDEGGEIIIERFDSDNLNDWVKIATFSVTNGWSKNYLEDINVNIPFPKPIACYSVENPESPGDYVYFRIRSFQRFDGNFPINNGLKVSIVTHGYFRATR